MPIPHPNGWGICFCLLLIVRREILRFRAAHSTQDDNPMSAELQCHSEQARSAKPRNLT